MRDSGSALGRLTAQIQEFAKGDSGNGALARERELLGQALDDVQGMVGFCVQELLASAQTPERIYKVGLNTTRVLMALGDLVVSWLLLRHAAVALTALAGTPSPRDRAFYEGKVAAARWFAASVLPELTARRVVVEATDLSLMELDEAAF